MKNTNIKSVVFIALVAVGMAISLSNSACKKKKDDPVEQPKTLTKSYLYDKKWYNQGGTITHFFNSNGKYGLYDSWAWLNNSDSMEIVFSGGGSRQVWYFEWSTEHEFSAKPSKNSGYILFKDQQW